MTVTAEELQIVAHARYCDPDSHLPSAHLSAHIYANACAHLPVTAEQIIDAIAELGFATGSYRPPHPDAVVALLTP